MNKELFKVVNELASIALATSTDDSPFFSTFLRLLSEKEGLTEQDKASIREHCNNAMENLNAQKKREEIPCSECNSIKYSNKYCENCMSEKLKSQFENWTSGNKLIDDFIKQC
ncbi:62_t:CDS:1, partial [Dentiscutata erythropus]